MRRPGRTSDGRKRRNPRHEAPATPRDPRRRGSALPPSRTLGPPAYRLRFFGSVRNTTSQSGEETP
jgi:hypothetical protein